ncbi:MAG: histidine kinase N-terminal 7TM domain-containing protein [Haloarculaceae archaeon]
MEPLQTVLASMPWLALGSLLAAATTLALVVYLRRYRGRAGATWFRLALAAQVVFCTTEGVGFLVSDPGRRLAFEAAGWIAICWMGILFLAFALEYTGRGRIIRRPAFLVLALVPAVTTSTPWATSRSSWARCMPASACCCWSTPSSGTARCTAARRSR